MEYIHSAVVHCTSPLGYVPYIVTDELARSRGVEMPVYALGAETLICGVAPDTLSVVFCRNLGSHSVESHLPPRLIVRHISCKHLILPCLSTHHSSLSLVSVYYIT